MAGRMIRGGADGADIGTSPARRESVPIAKHQEEEEAGSTYKRAREGSENFAGGVPISAPSAPPPPPVWPDGPLPAVLDGLRGRGLEVGPDGQIVGQMSARVAELVGPWATWFALVARMRATGFAAGACTDCGQWAFVSILNSSGSRRGSKSVPWPRCMMTSRVAWRRDRKQPWLTVSELTGCAGHVVVSADEIAQTKRVKPLAPHRDHPPDRSTTP